MDDDKQGPVKRDKVRPDPESPAPVNPAPVGAGPARASEDYPRGSYYDRAIGRPAEEGFVVRDSPGSYVFGPGAGGAREGPRKPGDVRWVPRSSTDRVARGGAPAQRPGREPGRLPAGAGRIFIDAGAFVAYWNEGDDAHEAVCEVMDELARKPLKPFTLRLMIAEAVTALARYISPAHAVAAAREIEAWADARLEIVEPSADDCAAALETLEHHDEPKLSYQDSVATSVMDRLRTRLAFTTDRRHFQGLFGHVVVP